MESPKEKEKKTTCVGKKGYIREPARGMDKMRRQCKGGQRQQQTERKQEEAAKTGCCFIKFILSPGSFLHSKIHYYIILSMGNFPKPTHTLRVSLLSPLLLTAEIFIISRASHQHITTTESVSSLTEEQTMQLAQSGF